jgi:hypothetical protein
MKPRQKTKARMARTTTIRAVLHTIERARAELLAVLLVAAKKKKQKQQQKQKKRTAIRRAAKGNA